MENGPWTILADGKEMVNTAIIPESQFFTQSNNKEVKAACMINTLPRPVQGGFTLHLPCSHLFYVEFIHYI